VSVEAMIEVAMWLLLACVAVGLTWAFFRAEQVATLESVLETRMPAGSELAAYLTTAGLWPWEMVGAHVVVALLAGVRRNTGMVRMPSVLTA